MKQIDEARARLANRKTKGLTYRQISADTGLGVVWLSLFNTRKGGDPRAFRVQVLNDYLRRKGVKPKVAE